MIEIDKYQVESHIPAVGQPLDIALPVLADGFDLTGTMVRPDSPQLTHLALGTGTTEVAIRNDLPKRALVEAAFMGALNKGWNVAGTLHDAHIMQPVPLADSVRPLASFIVSSSVWRVFHAVSQPIIRRRSPVDDTNVDILAVTGYDESNKLLLRNTSLDAIEQAALKRLTQYRNGELPQMSQLSLALVEDEVATKMQTDLRKSFSAGRTVPGEGLPEAYAYAVDSNALGADDVGEAVFNYKQWTGILDQFIEQSGEGYEKEVVSIVEQTSRAHNTEVVDKYMKSVAAKLEAKIKAEPETLSALYSDPDYASHLREVLQDIRAKFMQSPAVLPEMAGAYTLQDLISRTQDSDALRLPLLVPNVSMQALYSRWREDEDFHLVAFDTNSGMHANLLPYDEGALAVTRIPSRLFDSLSWVRFDMLSTGVFKQILAVSRREGSISIST